MRKTILREITGSIGRFLAILAIVALGAGFFTGLRVSTPAMLENANDYLAESKFFDFRVLSTLGFTQEDVDAFADLEGVSAANGSIYSDVLCDYPDLDEFVLKAHSITEDMNHLLLHTGRMPESANECVVDSKLFGEDAVGTTISISSNNTADTSDLFSYQTYTIVGLVSSPLYLNYERGTTSLGNGSVKGFVYLLPEGFHSDYFYEIYLKLEKTGYIYSDTYDDAIGAMEEPLTELAEQRAALRYQSIVEEAEQEIDKAQQEFDEGQNTYQQEKAKTEQELSNAWSTLSSAKAQIDSGRTEVANGWISFNTQISDAKAQIQSSQEELDNSYQSLTEAEAELAANEQTLSDSEAAYQTNLQTYQDGKATYESGLAAYETRLAEVQRLESELGPEPSESDLAALEAAKLELETTRLALEATDAELQNTWAQLSAAREQLDTGWAELEAGRQELDAGWQEYNNGSVAVSNAQAELEASESSGRQKLETSEAELQQAEQTYHSGLNNYYNGTKEAESAFSATEAELADAEQKLFDARAQVEEIALPTVHVLSRSSNIGYACFENDASIVKAISTVFPIFFFLVAALVCITTMTRMVDEQRTQTGILKALGYSRSTIMSKYIFYSGSASLIGSILGVLAGSYIFPKVIWEAYKMMYTFSESKFYFSVPLAAFSVISYLICSIGATLLACGHELSEVPAQLIRPKAPKNGKRIILERIPIIWNHLSFLKKVSIRNVFRYKGRMFMMVFGIGGCTALLLTGFGIKDSIQNVVNYQYDEITLYDYAITFSEAQDTDDYIAFLNRCGDAINDSILLRETSVDLNVADTVKSAYLVVTSDRLDKFISLHDGDRALSPPGLNEALININLANTFNLKVGDTITVRDSDMRELTLTICGIFDNYVYNYIYISSETYTTQLGEAPENNTAYILKKDSADIHETAATIMDAENVANVTVNADTRDRVNTMMSSLNYIVLLIIICAGSLAFIVLYNLTNINITERIREIATIKVLGFNEIESAAYVFRENLVLTAIGALVGLGLGKLLHAFVMAQIKIDLMYFDIRIAGLSYLYSIVLTFIFAVVVAICMYFKLQKINMAEALKSIE
ncbi:MAG: FtsX-like permease family protein [Oscillospiraceae bacterium]